MAELGYNDYEKAWMEQNSFVPETPEYSQSDWEALGVTWNATLALQKRRDFERQTYDITDRADIPFTKDAMFDYFKKSDTDPLLLNNLMGYPINSWQEAEAAKSWFSYIQESEKQVAENFSPATLYSAGIALAILDPLDLTLVNPVLSTAGKIKKGLNLSSKLGLTAFGAGTGAAVGVAAQATFEASTGIYNDDSFIEAAVVGSMLGGSLSMLLERAPQQTSLTRETNSEGRDLSPEEAKVEQLRVANEEAANLTSLIEEVNVKVNEQKIVEQELGAAEKADVGRASVDAKLEKEQLDKSFNFARDVKKVADNSLKFVKSNLDALIKGVTKTENTLVKTEQSVPVYKALQEEASTLTKSASSVKGQITKLTNKIESLQKVATKESKATIQALQEKLTPLEKQLKDVGIKLTRVNTKLSKFKASPEESLQSLQKEREALLKQRDEAQVVFDTNLKTAQENDAKFNNLKEQRDTFTFRKAKEAAQRDSLETKTLKDRLAQYNATLSPEGLRKLSQEYKVVQDDLAKMNADDFNLKKLYGIQKTKQNYIKKLNDELEEFNKVKDYADLAVFKRMPEWSKKLLISPVAKLLNSNTDKVAGFTSLLHSGTVYQGKIPSRTAWVVRNILDNKIDRMTKAILYLHTEAVKKGYKGKITDFQNEVASNLYEVTGKIQRDMFTEIDGTIIGMERFKVAQERAGSVTRKHTSNNEFVNKATDEVLNYYEYIHSYGNKLGMEAFKGSLGKGYFKRVYSTAKIEKLGRDNAINTLEQAQVNFAIATGSELTNATRAEFRELAKTAVDSALNKTARRESIVKPLGIPVQSTTSSLKQRTINAFDNEIADVLENEIIGVTQIYGLNTHGRLALKEKIGVDNDQQLEDIISKQLDATPQEQDNLRVLAQTILGTREISKNPFDPFTRALKMASSYSSVMHSMAFGVPTITEIASVAKEFGWAKTIDKFLGSVDDVYRVYRYGTPSEKNTIEMMISYGDASFATKVNRMDVESSMDSVGKVQEVVDDVIRKQAVFSGLLPITDMLRMTTASLSVDFLAGLSVAKRISKTDEMRLQDMGFGVEDLERIRTTLQVDSTGRIGNIDRKTWGQLDDDITAGVMTMVERTILNPNGATLPKFMTNMNEGQVVPRLMMKFMRFPFESYERMLIRGIQEADAKQMLALGGNIAMWTAVLSMKDAIKEPEKQMYTGADGINKLMMDSFLNNSFTTLPISLSNTTAGLLTGENLTNDYRYRIGGVVQSDYESALKGDFKLTVPFTSINIGDAVGNALNNLYALEELNKE